MSFQNILDKIYKNPDSKTNISGPMSFIHLQKKGVKNIYLFGDHHWSLQNICKTDDKDNIMFHNFIEKLVEENPEISFDIGFEVSRFENLEFWQKIRASMLKLSTEYFLKNGKLKYNKHLEEKRNDRYHYLDVRSANTWDSPKIYESANYESFELLPVVDDDNYVFKIKLNLLSHNLYTKEFKKDDIFELLYKYNDYEINDYANIYFLEKGDDSLMFYLKDEINMNNVKISISTYDKLANNFISDTNAITDQCNDIFDLYPDDIFYRLSLIKNNMLKTYKKSLYKVYWLFCNTFFLNKIEYEQKINSYLGLDSKTDITDTICQFPNINKNNRCIKINNFNDSLITELINKITNIHFVKKFFIKKEKNPSDYTIKIEDIKNYISFRVEKLVDNDIFKTDIIETFANILIEHNFYDSDIPNYISEKITNEDAYKLRNNISWIQKLIFDIEVLFMDLYTIIRISKIYQKNVIFYGGDAHCQNIVKFYKSLGYKIINENNINSELDYYKKIRLPEINKHFDIIINNYMDKIKELESAYNSDNNFEIAFKIENIVSEMNLIRKSMDDKLRLINNLEPCRCINIGDSFNKKHLIS